MDFKNARKAVKNLNKTGHDKIERMSLIAFAVSSPVRSFVSVCLLLAAVVLALYLVFTNLLVAKRSPRQGPLRVFVLTPFASHQGSMGKFRVGGGGVSIRYGLCAAASTQGVGNSLSRCVRAPSWYCRTV